MKVILLQDVSGLGKRFDVKDVADGHAINLLIPKKLAREATVSALKQIETEKSRVVVERAIQEDLLAKNIADLDGKTIHFSAKANEQGHLFAAIHDADIVKQLKAELHVDAHKEFIQSHEPIKSVGENVLEVSVKGKLAKFTVFVEAEVAVSHIVK